jgi:hypothetical protein
MKGQVINMKANSSIFDRFGGPWQALKYLSIFIVLGIVLNQSYEIYGYVNDVRYIDRDFLNLSWDKIENGALSFYIIEIVDTVLESHGFYHKGSKFINSMRADHMDIKVPVQNYHSYTFRIRCVFKDGSVSEALNYEPLIICQLPADYVSDLNSKDLKPKESNGKLKVVESFDVNNAENIRPFVTDLDNDGLEDLIVGKKDGTIDFYKRVAQEDKKKFDFEFPRAIVSGNQVLDVGDSSSPYAYDYNSDGFKDLFVGNQSGEIRLYTNLGRNDLPGFDSGKVVKSTADDVNLGLYVTLCVTDWNNDGYFDLVTGNDEGYVNLYLNAGSNTEPVFGNFQPIKSKGKDITLGSYTQPIIYDWNGDGKKDLLVSDSSGNIFLYKNEGLDSEPIFDDKANVLKIDGVPTISISSMGLGFKVLIGSQNGYISFYN